MEDTGMSPGGGCPPGWCLHVTQDGGVMRECWDVTWDGGVMEGCGLVTGGGGLQPCHPRGRGLGLWAGVAAWDGGVVSLLGNAVARGDPGRGRRCQGAPAWFLQLPLYRQL